jgi:hypothetical protein
MQQSCTPRVRLPSSSWFAAWTIRRRGRADGRHHEGGVPRVPDHGGPEGPHYF